MTYLRRYSLMSAFGLTGDDDNDGDAPQAPPPRKVQQKPVQPDPQPTSGPLPDDEQVIYETEGGAFIKVAAALLEADQPDIKARLKALGYTSIPGDVHKRLDAYRKLKAADARQGSLLPGQPANGAFQET